MQGRGPCSRRTQSPGLKGQKTESRETSSLKETTEKKEASAAFLMTASLHYRFQQILFPLYKKQPLSDQSISFFMGQLSIKL